MMHQPEVRIPPHGVGHRWTNVHDIPFNTMQQLKIMLDPSTQLGRNWEGLAAIFGLNYSYIRYLNEYQKRTETVIWEIYPQLYPDACVEEIILALDELGRLDARDILLKSFPDLKLEQLREDWKSRGKEDDELGDSMDTGQQHQEPCLSGCTGSNIADDSDSDSEEMYPESVSSSIRRKPTNLTFTVEQLAKLNQKPNGARIPSNSFLMSQNVSRTGDSTNVSMLPPHNGVSLTNYSSHNGSPTIHRNNHSHNMVGEVAFDNNYIQSCEYHLTSGHSLPAHCVSCSSQFSTSGYFNNKQCSNCCQYHNPSMHGQTSFIQTCDDAYLHDCSTPMDLSVGHSVGQDAQIVPTKGQGRQMILSQGQMMHHDQMIPEGQGQQFQPSHQSHQMLPSGRQTYHPQFNLTSTGCSDVRIGGISVQNTQRNATSPLVVSGQFQMKSGSTELNLSTADKLTTVKSHSWPVRTPNPLENVLTDIQPKSGHSANSILQTVPHETAPRPSVFLTYTNDSKATMKRVLDCGECLKKNNFKVSVDVFVSDLLSGATKNADWHNMIYEKANFILVIISKNYRETIESGNELRGGTHAKQIYNRILQDGKNSKRRIVLLLFPNTDPKIHIPPPLREIADQTYEWPQSWRNVFYYLIFPQQVMHMPLSDNSSISSTESNLQDDHINQWIDQTIQHAGQHQNGQPTTGQHQNAYHQNSQQQNAHHQNSQHQNGHHQNIQHQNANHQNGQHQISDVRQNIKSQGGRHHTFQHPNQHMQTCNGGMPIQNGRVARGFQDSRHQQHVGKRTLDEAVAMHQLHQKSTRIKLESLEQSIRHASVKMNGGRPAKPLIEQKMC